MSYRSFLQNQNPWQENYTQTMGGGVSCNKDSLSVNAHRVPLFQQQPDRTNHHCTVTPGAYIMANKLPRTFTTFTSVWWRTRFHICWKYRNLSTLAIYLPENCLWLFICQNESSIASNKLAIWSINKLSVWYKHSKVY